MQERYREIRCFSEALTTEGCGSGNRFRTPQLYAVQKSDAQNLT